MDYRNIFNKWTQYQLRSLNEEVSFDKEDGVFGMSWAEWAASMSAEPVEQAMLLFAARSATQGDLRQYIRTTPEQWKMLGQGAHGIALGVDSDTVLKLTTDQQEARASATVAETRLKFTNVIDRVLKFQWQGEEGGPMPGWAIIQSKLAPLGNDVRVLINAAYQVFWRNKSLAEALWQGENISDEWFNAARQAIPDASEDTLGTIRKIIQWLCLAIMELAQAGVEWRDCHSGNIMYDPTIGGQNNLRAWRIVDLGMSNSPGGDMGVLMKEGVPVFECSGVGAMAAPMAGGANLSQFTWPANYYERKGRRSKKGRKK